MFGWTWTLSYDLCVWLNSYQSNPWFHDCRSSIVVRFHLFWEHWAIFLWNSNSVLQVMQSIGFDRCTMSWLLFHSVNSVIVMTYSVYNLSFTAFSCGHWMSVVFWVWLDVSLLTSNQVWSRLLNIKLDACRPIYVLCCTGPLNICLFSLNNKSAPH